MERRFGRAGLWEEGASYDGIFGVMRRTVYSFLLVVGDRAARKYVYASDDCLLCVGGKSGFVFLRDNDN